MTRPTPAYHSRQEFAPDRSGRRRAVHTRGLGEACRCAPCVSRRWYTPERRAAQADRMRRQWAEGTFAGRARGLHPRRWTRREDQALADLAGTLPLPDVTAELNRRFSTDRTVVAVGLRARRLGLSVWQGGYSLRDLERVFGVAHQTIARSWVEPGLLVGRRWDGRGPHAGWWFEPAEVERFVRDCGWLFDVARMKRSHPLTTVAELAHRSDPWLVGSVAVAGALGLSEAATWRWIKRGLVPFRRRPNGGGPGMVCVRGRDVPAIRAAIDEERALGIARSRAHFTSRARGQAA